MNKTAGMKGQDFEPDMTDAYRLGKQCRIAGMAAKKKKGFKHACVKIHDKVDDEEYRDLAGLFFAGNITEQVNDAVDTEIGDSGSGFVCLLQGRTETQDRRQVLTGKYSHLSLIQFHIQFHVLFHIKFHIQSHI